MKQLTKVLLILVILVIATNAANAALRKAKNAKKQQQIAVDIIKNGMKVSLTKDNSIQKKLSVMNFIEESTSVSKNKNTYTQRRYDEFTKTIEKYEKDITPERSAKFKSMIQTKTGTKTPLLNHSNTFYTGNVYVGNKEQPYKMIFDTGSTLIFLNSVKCDDIGCVRGNQYDSDLSPTFKDTDLQVEVEFGSGVLQGEMGVDKFYIDDMEIKNVSFMEITSQDGAVFEDGDFDGLIGLAFPALGDGVDTVVDYMKEQNLVDFKQFSFYMSRRDESNSSFVSFGDIDDSMINGDIKYHKVKSPLYWSIMAEEIRLGGKNTGLCSKEQPCPLAIDSGTSVIAGPSRATNLLGEMIVSAGYGCDQINEMPTLTYVIDGTEYSLLAQEYMISTSGFFADMYEHSNNPQDCSPAFIPLDIEEPNLGPLWIMGDIFMSKYYTVFNREEKTVGFGKLNNLDAKFYQSPPKRDD